MFRNPLLSSALFLLLLPLSGCLGQMGSGVAATESRAVEGAVAFHLANFVAAEVEVAPGPASMELTCDDDLLEFLETEVVDGVLVLRTEAGINLFPRVSCTAIVRLPQLFEAYSSGSGRLTIVGDVEEIAIIVNSGSGGLRAAGVLEGVHVLGSTGSGRTNLASVSGCAIDLESSGSGGIDVDRLLACELEVRHSGSGGIRLAGQAEALELDQSGSGSFGDAGFEVRQATLSVSGSGGAELTVAEEVTLSLSGSGGVRVHGRPSIHGLSETGSGRVSFVD